MDVDYVQHVTLFSCFIMFSPEQNEKKKFNANKLSGTDDLNNSVQVPKNLLS